MINNIQPHQFEYFPQNPNFLITKEYKRFKEFCLACKEEKYIGICHGKPGIGKTLSARKYANWDIYLHAIQQRKQLSTRQSKVLARSETFFYTTPVLAAPKKTRTQIIEGIINFGSTINQTRQQLGMPTDKFALDYCKLIIIDEADRLKMNTLEELRDFYDHFNVGMILIGMPGIEKRLSRYPQFYSRVGFAHEFKLLSNDDVVPVIEHFWKKTKGNLAFNDKINEDVIAAITRITNGNFRLIQRLFKQIKRILKINKLSEITVEVVQTARDCLVIGSV